MEEKMDHDKYIYFVKQQGQDATVRRFLKDPITPTKVRTFENGTILYRVEKVLLEGDDMTGYSRPNTMGTVVIACFVLLLIWAFVS